VRRQTRRWLALVALVVATEPATALAQYFPPNSVWAEDVSAAPLHPQSAAVIAKLAADGGWGNGNRLQIDFSLVVLHADETTPMRGFTPNGNFYSPDCDTDDVPVPPGGALEGEADYECSGGGDCHLLVVKGRTLYEMYSANIAGGQYDGAFDGGCLAVWDLSRRYAPRGRGEQCTSADAAGFPIAPLLFTADEVAAGKIDHAVRFILPNNRMRQLVYVHPATHAGAPSNPSADAIPYGARLRLRADYPLASLPNEGARTVARALQRYGMLLADGGNIALTAADDRFTTAKWAGRLGPHDLYLLQVGDFEMVQHPGAIALTYDCVRAARDIIFEWPFDP
jgi:serine/threonine-protein kinase